MDSVGTVRHVVDVVEAMLLLPLRRRRRRVLQVDSGDAGDVTDDLADRRCLHGPLLRRAGRRASSGADVDRRSAAAGAGVVDVARAPTRREGAAERVAEVLGGVVVDDRVDARVGVGQALPDDAHSLQRRHISYQPVVIIY